MDPIQRAAFLEEDEEMKNAHSIAATAGDTECFSESKWFPVTSI
uniref:UCH catalytic domain-containing protein n=1 Tax=Zea mays TaxID=4577 RepID=C0PG36_MAIZE|nr:unknown [Zea mays]